VNQFFFLVVVVAVVLDVVVVSNSQKILFRNTYIDKTNLKYKTKTYITNLYLSKTESNFCLQTKSEKVIDAIKNFIRAAVGAPYQT